MSKRFDAVVVGSGPNGIASAIVLQQQGLNVKLIETHSRPGGGLRSAELTLPGFVHDVCSAIHPLGRYSPFFNSLPLHEHGLEWIYPELELAHPFDNGSAAVLNRSIQATAASLGGDAENYIKLITPLTNAWDDIARDVLGPPLKLPDHLLKMTQFGLQALSSATGLARRRFKNEAARGLFAGICAHSIRPLEESLTAAIGLVLTITGHKTGWPFPKGGSQSLTNALISFFTSIGGQLETGYKITSYNELEFAKVKIFDLSPGPLLQIRDLTFPERYRKQLQNYRHGPGVFKIDYALSESVPFKAPECNKAGTIHLGGSMEEIAYSESQVWKGKHPEKPFLLFSQHSMFDATRSPAGKHTGWVYCHVPKGSTVDMTSAIEQQIERFAPGFRDTIIAKSIMNTVELEQYNPNYVGGDIAGGVADLKQLYARPAFRISPYSTPMKDVYICSASTPPGAGVHGICGFHAARKALADHFNIRINLPGG